MNESRLIATDARWLRAQEFELATWKSQNSWHRRILTKLAQLLGLCKISEGDDWNNWWSAQFQYFQAIPFNLNNAIEIGCGPYTNMRLILRNRNIRQVICSDPLANHYLKMKSCWLASAYKKGAVSIDASPIEKCPFPNDYFDLVVLINVLDHVQNALVGLMNGIRIVKPAGYLVIGQDLTNNADISNNGDDIMHPIRIHENDLNEFLFQIFIPLFFKILKREEGRNPPAHYGTYLFIGQKLN